MRYQILLTVSAEPSFDVRVYPSPPATIDSVKDDLGIKGFGKGLRILRVIISMMVICNATVVMLLLLQKHDEKRLRPGFFINRSLDN